MEVDASLVKDGDTYTLTFEDLVWEGPEDDLRRLIGYLESRDPGGDDGLRQLAAYLQREMLRFGDGSGHPDN
jgi:hypothetical protein